MGMGSGAVAPGDGGECEIATRTFFLARSPDAPSTVDIQISMSTRSAER